MTMNTRASRLMESLNGTVAPRKSINETVAEHTDLCEKSRTSGSVLEAKASAAITNKKKLADLIDKYRENGSKRPLDLGGGLTMKEMEDDGDSSSDFYYKGNKIGHMFMDMDGWSLVIKLNGKELRSDNIYDGIVEYHDYIASLAKPSANNVSRRAKSSWGDADESQMAGWIAMYNGKKLEITLDQASGMYAAKQLAIKELRVPKSKQGLLAIAPAYNESTETAVDEAKASAAITNKKKLADLIDKYRENGSKRPLDLGGGLTMKEMDDDGDSSSYFYYKGNKIGHMFMDMDGWSLVIKLNGKELRSDNIYDGIVEYHDYIASLAKPSANNVSRRAKSSWGDADESRLSEKLKDASKLDFSQSESNVEDSIKALTDAGFRVKFDTASNEGVASHKGLAVDFTVGGENLYFTLPEFYFKSAADDAAKAVKDLLGEVSNWGGTVDS